MNIECKIKIIILSLLLISCKINKEAEKNKHTALINSTSEIIMPPPPPPVMNYTNLIGLGCGYGGTKTESIIFFSDLLKNKKYSIIKEKLYSEIPSEKYLSSIICETLYKKNLIELYHKQLNRISENYKSSDELFICSGCTQNEKLRINEMTLKKNFLKRQMLEWINKYLE